MAYEELMNCSVNHELISIISIGRLFHSLMVPQKKTLLVCMVEVTGADKVIQMVLSSWIFKYCIVRYICSMVASVWLGYDGILFYAIELAY